MTDTQQIKNIVAQLASLPQRQDSTRAQLLDLVLVANHLGMYDAADFITSRIGGDV